MSNTKKRSKSLDTRVIKYKNESQKKTITIENSSKHSKKMSLKKSESYENKMSTNEFSIPTTAVRLNEPNLSVIAWKILQGL